MPLTPKSVFVTGANRGIGYEFVRQFARLPQPPQHIFAGCRNPDKAPELVELAKQYTSIHVLKLDVSQFDSYGEIKETIQRVVEGDGLNLLINNAGVIFRVNLPNVTAQALRESYEVNTMAPVLLTQTLLPLLKAAAATSNKDGLSCSRAAVINMSSILASCEYGGGGAYDYRCSKTALNMATISLATDMRQFGILAAAVHPGWVQTPLGGPGANSSPQESVEDLMKLLERFGDRDTGCFYAPNGRKLPW